MKMSTSFGIPYINFHVYAEGYRYFVSSWENNSCGTFCYTISEAVLLLLEYIDKGIQHHISEVFPGTDMAVKYSSEYRSLIK